MTPNHPTTAGLVYYGEPIDLAAGPGHAGYQITRALADLGMTCFRPATAWAGGNHNPLFVERINRETLYTADAVIADFSTGRPTTGLPMEVEAATARGIPVVVLVNDQQPRSVALQANQLCHFTASWQESADLAYKLAEQHWAGSGPNPADMLKVLLTEGQTAVPSRGYPDDGGVDLTTSETTVIEPGTFADVPTTISGVQLPPWSWGMITGRSSTLRKRGLLVPTAVIDAGWRGPLFAGAMNMTAEPVKVEVGERIAQLIIMNNDTARVTIRQVQRLDPHERGLRGFGSSGGTGNSGVIGQMVTLTPANPSLYPTLPAAPAAAE